jgi:hypothetical protein
LGEVVMCHAETTIKLTALDGHSKTYLLVAMIFTFLV